MKNSFAVIFNLLYWSCYFLIQWFLFYLLSQGYGSPNLKYIVRAEIALVIAPSLLAFYGIYLYVFPRFLNKKLWLKGAGHSLAVLFACVLLSVALIIVLFPSSVITEGKVLDSLIMTSMMLVIAFINGVMAWVIAGFVRWFSDFQINQKLRSENESMKMALIKSKFDPHFLFNSLNNIDVLINDNPTSANTYINGLSEILRFAIYESDQKLVALNEELDQLKKYIDLQKIRTQNEEFVKFEWSGNIENSKIVPMTLIPFVENAFKHCTNKKEGMIDISLKVENNKLYFDCVNSCDSSYKTEVGNGIGLDLIRKQLELTYAEKHNLIVRSDNGVFNVHLELTHA